jgi:hypothetical protein
MQRTEITEKVKGLMTGSLKATFNEAKREYNALEKVHGEEAMNNGTLSGIFAATAGLAAVCALTAPLATAIGLGGVAVGVGYTAYKFAQQAKHFSQDFKKNGPPSYERPPQ